MTSQTVTGTLASTTPDCVVGPLVPLVSQSLAVFPTRPTLTEQMVTGASALIAPLWAVDADWPFAKPSAAAAWFNSPIALSCAVIGALTLARPPGWFSPTEVVEQLLLESATTPMESEHALTGTSTLAAEDDCPVELVPFVEFWPGSSVVPTSFDNAETGAATDTGEEGSGSDAGPGAVGVAEPVACATAEAAAFCAACTVVCRSGGDGVAPLAGVTPTTPPTARTSPLVKTLIDVNRFRFMALLLLCVGGHTPARKRRPSLIPEETRNLVGACEGGQEL
jgi:hypothetical protein